MVRNMDPEEALNELTKYMNEMLKFCRERGIGSDIHSRLEFIMVHWGRGVYTKEDIESLEQLPEFWDYIILDYEFSGKNVRELFVREHSELPREVKQMILNMKSVHSVFFVEEIDRKNSRVVLRRPYTKDRYVIWTKILLDTLVIGDLVRCRVITWRGHNFVWGFVMKYRKELAEKIKRHEEFLEELEDDIESFLDIEKERLSERTYRKRKDHLWTFYEYIQKRPEINDYRRLTKTLIKGYIKWLRRMIGISKTYIRENITSVRKFFGFLQERNKITKNPAKEIQIL